MISKKIFLLILSTILLCTLISCKETKELYFQIIKPTTKDELKIVVTSDTHFLPKFLVEEGSANAKPNYYGDGRIIVYNEELIKAFIWEMEKVNPDAVIITGDLSFNGAKTIHEDLANKLNVLVEKGIRVLVIPGNHDINSAISAIYKKGKAEAIPSVNASEFKEIYYNHGYGNSLFQDESSLSYCYAVSEKVWLVMLDSVIYEASNNQKTLNAGIIKTNTLKWLDDVLTSAEINNAKVIVCSHHNLFIHNEMFISDYQLFNSQDVETILNKHKVNLYLSGHMHIQDYVQKENLTEILSSSLSIYGNHYGILNITDNEINYETKEVDVSLWALSNNIHNNDLINFHDYSFDFFTKSSYEKTYNNIMFNDSSSIELAEAFAWAQSVLNPAYFNGDVIDVVNVVKNDLRYEIIIKNSNNRSYQYLSSMINSNTKNNNYLTITW